MASIFSKIIQGELPCEKIYETTSEIAFLDIYPVSPGHTLVVPKREVAKFENLPESEAIHLMKSLHKVASAISKAYGVDYNIILNDGPGAGQEVPHVHFHIIPRPEGSSMGFKSRSKYPDNLMKETGKKIREKLS